MGVRLLRPCPLSFQLRLPLAISTFSWAGLLLVLTVSKLGYLPISLSKLASSLSKLPFSPGNLPISPSKLPPSLLRLVAISLTKLLCSLGKLCLTSMIKLPTTLSDLSFGLGQLLPINQGRLLISLGQLLSKLPISLGKLPIRLTTMRHVNGLGNTRTKLLTLLVSCTDILMPSCLECLLTQPGMAHVRRSGKLLITLA